jgi:hypothetical protein
LNIVRCKTWETLYIGFKKAMLKKLGKRKRSRRRNIKVGEIL